MNRRRLPAPDKGRASTLSEDDAHQAARPTRQLGLFDAICIMVGIVIGVGIYESPPRVAATVPGPAALLLVWALGGLLAFIGALCYAELATAYPRSGGDYVYLTTAYGSWVGFLYGWAELLVIRTGSIAAMAFVFADYMTRIAPLGPRSPVVYSATLVALLSLLNVLGVREGKWTQNTLTVSKVLGLSTIAAIGVVSPFGGGPPPPAPHGSAGSLGLAMIFVLWTYGGWNENAYVAAEVKEPQRNIPRSLLLGTGLVTLVYLGINWVFLHGLGFDRLRSSQAAAADLLAAPFGSAGERLMVVLVAVSAVGAVNGQIFTGARIGYALGTDHSALSRLGAWSRRFGTPAWALIAQGLITLTLIATLGSRDGFETLVKYTAAVFWFFFLLTGLALLILRRTDRERPRPYPVPGYPFTPLAFCASSAYMLYGSLSYAPLESLWGAALVLSGLPLYWLSSGGAKERGRP
ncbi:MAG: amino acid permease [Candidatus Rokubacteria bacterium]|nr:amino acid permease [Candidatus Rokubacteria bacterium]